MAMPYKAVKNIKLFDNSLLKFETHDSLESTAELAKSYANSAYPNKYVVYTQNQTGASQTKGLRSDKQSGIYMSCILRPSFFPAQAALLAPLATVALLTALEEHTDSKLGIGWLSEIYCNGKKIGGVTIEGKLDSYSSYEYLIVNFSIAINDKDFPPRLNDIVKKVFEADNDSIYEIIAKTILHKFFSVYSSLKKPAKYMDTYVRRFALVDKRIKYIKDGKKHACRVVSVAKDTCAITVDIGKGELMQISSPSGVITPNKIQIRE